MNIIKKIADFFLPLLSPSLKVAKKQQLPNPKFLLPKTMGEYEKRREALIVQNAARSESNMIEADRLDREADRLRIQVADIKRRGGTVVKKELNRREAVELSEKSLRCKCKAISLRTEAPVRLQRELEDEVKELLAALRKEEAELLAHQGEIVKQTFNDPSAAESLSFGEDGTAVRYERRIVLHEGRAFLVHLTWHAVMRTVHHKSGGRYDGPFDTYVPTGEWKPPVADWATDSVAQMSDEELKAAIV